MKQKIILLVSACLLLAGTAQAQWVVSDPGNLVQGIINTTKQIVQTSTTAKNTLDGFKETAKIFEQGKKYYDALKSVNNLVKDAVKVRNTILMVGEISEIYVTNFQLMLRDENYTPEELSAIAFGYTKLLEESNNALKEMKEVVNITTLSMSDKERMDVVDRCYNSVRRYRNLVMYYTNKNISVNDYDVDDHRVRQPAHHPALALFRDDAALLRHGRRGERHRGAGCAVLRGRTRVAVARPRRSH